MTSKDAKQVLREMIPTIAHYDREARQQIALRMAIEALDAAEKQEKIERHLLRIAETFEKVNEAITDIADHFGSQMAMIIDTLEPIAKVFRDDDEAAADADETCDNDCEHCDWATCPKEDDDL